MSELLLTDKPRIQAGGEGEGGTETIGKVGGGSSGSVEGSETFNSCASMWAVGDI